MIARRLHHDASCQVLPRTLYRKSRVTASQTTAHSSKTVTTEPPPYSFMFWLPGAFLFLGFLSRVFPIDKKKLCLGRFCFWDLVYTPGRFSGFSIWAGFSGGGVYVLIFAKSCGFSRSRTSYPGFSVSYNQVFLAFPHIPDLCISLGFPKQPPSLQPRGFSLGFSPLPCHHTHAWWAASVLITFFPIRPTQ